MADRGPLRIDTSNERPVPPIAAAFLVNFDHRKGYTLGWHRSLEDVQVEGVVEFKSLPSGLHNVEEDLVYFIHDDYCGLSAFLNQPDEQSERSARMLAIGVLVPLENGRIGRSWRHAESLKELARYALNMEDTSALEEYWGKYKPRPGDRPVQTPYDSAEQFSSQQVNGYRKARTMSTATTFISSLHALTPHHPALTLLDSINLFGPLIFPLYRAALLRKRILVVTDTPVEFSCNLVYNISILSSISQALSPLLPADSTPSLRLRPLFTVGVLDIPQLKRSKTSPDSSWIACTTDDVLSTKPDLYDILVLMPPSESQNAAVKVFPRVIVSSPGLNKAFPKTGVKSTRRDFRRFVHLQQGLLQFPRSQVTGKGTETSDNNDAASISTTSSSYSDNKAVVEPSSWSRVAYTSLVWWASAGDRRGGFAETEEAETERDFALVRREGDDEQTREVALVAYFHRMTGIIFQTIAKAIARTDGRNADAEPCHDDDDDEDDARPVEPSALAQRSPVEGEESQGLLAEPEKAKVEINEEDMAAMGLDSWSVSDEQFVEELVQRWWGRKAVVRAGVIECCGLRIL
ncbi:uncharacterized protein Z518_02415 [Rhinocladiella mackenziei CBS 650.93]|uniref:Rhinocladiella mackenziei CBS 650.93 unplaced genomic scaffold supercont1.2, whole genome shotgun sequence n=1 Tax=Rhinocladiella mackenziei CBS 650.93 TaxID=1442369 RepID=A0A0D2IWL2_9EURO|nr:uncharacterized protein Z518_02415 [Rhinocladiella mackenziei CBS 650.93]KIX07761.1 hypothetical protein Z518_02415 [Rhinocladiella mackenziei CBS 650.93]